MFLFMLELHGTIMADGPTIVNGMAEVRHEDAPLQIMLKASTKDSVLEMLAVYVVVGFNLVQDTSPTVKIS